MTIPSLCCMLNILTAHYIADTPVMFLFTCYLIKQGTPNRTRRPPCPKSSSSSASHMGDPEEKCTPTLFTAKPCWYCWKTSRVGQKTVVFVVIRVGLCGEERGGAFLFRIPQMQCRTRARRGDFLKFIRRAEHCGHLYGAATPRSSKDGERLWKKGGKFSLSVKN